MISLAEVGAHPQLQAPGQWSVRFGIYLPGLTYDKGYRLKVRAIHEGDQFVRGIDPKEFWMNWTKGSALDLWTAEVQLTPEPAPSHFGQTGRYVYRYQLLRSDGRSIAFWFADPFARESAVGTLSASQSITRRPSRGPTRRSYRPKSTPWSSMKSTCASSTWTSTV